MTISNSPTTTHADDVWVARAREIMPRDEWSWLSDAEYERRVRAAAEELEREQDEADALALYEHLTPAERITQGIAQAEDVREVIRDAFARHGIRPEYMSPGSDYYELDTPDGSVTVRVSDHDPRPTGAGPAIDIHTGSSPRGTATVGCHAGAMSCAQIVRLVSDIITDAGQA